MIATYDTDRLFEEIAYIAYHFHWPLEEIGRINQRLAEEA